MGRRHLLGGGRPPIAGWLTVAHCDRLVAHCYGSERRSGDRRTQARGVLETAALAAGSDRAEHRRPCQPFTALALFSAAPMSLFGSALLLDSIGPPATRLWLSTLTTSMSKLVTAGPYKSNAEAGRLPTLLRSKLCGAYRWPRGPDS